MIISLSVGGTWLLRWGSKGGYLPGDGRPVRVQLAGRNVHGWSTTRLPYEPKGWLLEYRAALRTGLRSLTPADGLGLVARYYAPDSAFVDIENVLCYNLGASCYAHLIGGGLRLTRYRSPEGPHHLTYHLQPIVAGEIPPFAVVSAAVPHGTHSAGQWWSLLRPNVHLNQMLAGRNFGIEVHVSGSWTSVRLQPRSSRCSTAWSARCTPTTSPNPANSSHGWPPSATRPACG